MLQTTSRDLADAEKERQARRANLQRAIMDLRSQQASELTRDLLSSDRPKVSTDDTRSRSMNVATAPIPRHRPASARTTRDRRPLWMREDYSNQGGWTVGNEENVVPEPGLDRRPVSADSRSRVESGGPRVTVSDRPSRPFTDLVRLQRPELTRQNWDRVRTKTPQDRPATATSDKTASCSSTARLTVHGQCVCVCVCASYSPHHRHYHHFFRPSMDCGIFCFL